MALIKFDKWKILSGEIVPEKVVPVKYQQYTKNAKGSTVVDLNTTSIDSTKKLLSLHTAKTSQIKFNQVIDTSFQDFPVQENDNAIVLLQSRLNALLGEKNSLLSERDVNRDRIDELNATIEDLRRQLRDALTEFANYKSAPGAGVLINEIPDALTIGFDGIFLYSDRTGLPGAPESPKIQNQLLSKNRKARLIIQEDGNMVITKGEFDGKGNPLVKEEFILAAGWDGGETGPNFLHLSRGDKSKKQAYIAVGGLWPMYVERWRSPIFDNVSNQARVVLDDMGTLNLFDRDRLLWSTFSIDPVDFNLPYTRPEFKRDGSKGSGYDDAQVNRKRREDEAAAARAAQEKAAADEARRKALLEEEARRKEFSKTLPGMWRDAGKSISSEFSAAGKNIAQTTKAVGKAIGKFFKSDRRLKTDFVLIGQSPSGINIYEFKYKSNPNVTYQGAIADELIGTQFDNAVYIDTTGYLAIDYSKIDVKFKEI